jgi:hypothetical protein
VSHTRSKRPLIMKSERRQMKVSSEQIADIVCRMQVKNPDGTWAVLYKDLAAEFGVSRCIQYPKLLSVLVWRDANTVGNTFHSYASAISRRHSYGICTRNCVAKWA